MNCLDYNKKNPIDLKDNRISLGQINVLPTPQESFIISKKYGEDYNFFDSSGDFQNNNEPFSLDDSKIMEDIPEKNNEGSFNSISNSSDLFFIQYPKIVLNYENNTFLLPKTIDLNLSEDLQSTQNNRLIVKSNAFLESKFNLEKTQRSFEHNKDKEKYKSITKTIEKHLNDPKNSLCFIKTKYIRYFQEKYEEFAYKPLDFNSKELKTLEMICDSMMKDLRQFIRLFKDSIYYFYNIKELCLKNHNLSQYFTLDNMINFVLCIFFIDEVYSIVFEIQRKLDFNKEAIFKKNLKKIRDRRPEDFGISDRFCLNQKTKNYFKSFFSKNKPEQFEKNKILEENEEEFKENSTDKLDYNTCEPYAKAIDCIKNIQFLRSPTHKLKAILTSSEMIMECINEFYKKINVKFNKDIDPDDIMTIYIYMISKSPLTTLITHCNLIEKFLTESSLASISGYYFVTLNASIDYIINLKEEVQKIKENPNFNGETEKKLSSLSSNINDQRVLEE